MNFINANSHVLYLWSGEINENIEEQVNEIKTIENVKVNVENIERLSLAHYQKSSFDIILSNLSSNWNPVTESITEFMKLVKPNGKVLLRDELNKFDEIASCMKSVGFINIENQDNVIIGQKPNYEVGSSVKLFSGASEAKTKVKEVWKIDNDDDEIINPDDLLDAEDLEKPDPSTLRVCGTTGKRKACKDCSCGLAEELAVENPVKPIPTQTSSCGSCYLGDAFRCATCPYLGMPAFKPGDKIQISDNLLKADL